MPLQVVMWKSGNYAWNWVVEERRVGPQGTTPIALAMAECAVSYATACEQAFAAYDRLEGALK